MGSIKDNFKLFTKDSAVKHHSMKYPKNELAQKVIASCVAHGIQDVVISPGCRNAPLTVGFTSHSDVETYSVVDERCAAFVALGMAQQKGKPVALVCTSGSALLNYYPAISEAFYSDIPLVVLSADRPHHLVDVGDGQTIRQKNVFENHVLFGCDLQEENSESHEELLSEALSMAYSHRGPVHVNVPFDEPLYDTVSEMLCFPKKTFVERSHAYLKESPLSVPFLEKFAQKWNKAERKIVLVGSHEPDALLQTQLAHLAKDPSVLVFVETTSNSRNDSFITAIDQLLFPLNSKDYELLRPDILITLGGMVVSKRVKQFFRCLQPSDHWHIDVKRSVDCFHCLTQYFQISPQLFFSQFFFLTKVYSSDYRDKWMTEKSKRRKNHKDFLKNVSYSDLQVHDTVLRSLPSNIQLQLSNSSVIRYAQLFDIDPSIAVFCNRGTSGIDGSTSTAIGAAMVREEQTVFITGDISFFYDSNALWNNYIPKNFRIILINNDGGGIFKFIPGPSKSEVEDYFVTPHGLHAEHLCKMHGFTYSVVSELKNLERELEQFYKNSPNPKLLEIHTPSGKNDKILKEYFNNLK